MLFMRLLNRKQIVSKITNNDTEISYIELVLFAFILYYKIPSGFNKLMCME